MALFISIHSSLSLGKLTVELQLRSFISISYEVLEILQVKLITSYTFIQISTQNAGHV